MNDAVEQGNARVSERTGSNDIICEKMKKNKRERENGRIEGDDITKRSPPSAYRPPRKNESNQSRRQKIKPTTDDGTKPTDQQQQQQQQQHNQNEDTTGKRSNGVSYTERWGRWF